MRFTRHLQFFWNPGLNVKETQNNKRYPVRTKRLSGWSILTLQWHADRNIELKVVYTVLLGISEGSLAKTIGHIIATPRMFDLLHRVLKADEITNDANWVKNESQSWNPDCVLQHVHFWQSSGTFNAGYKENTVTFSSMYNIQYINRVLPVKFLNKAACLRPELFWGREIKCFQAGVKVHLPMELWLTLQTLTE